VTFPVVVIRLIELLPVLVNHSAPSGPTVIPLICLELSGQRVCG